MKVTRLEISGFKSFADRTVLDFPQEMCAVVGPNGCGKSNVVDAIRWVLGEQSAKTLRGSAMEDVIFNGAETRSQAGLSEVSLIFENNGDITSPQFCDLSEIMVTRRLYRSGDSEYLINKVPCRLKDIQQLFMDTGLGNRAYAIIEQGRVAAFIEAKPEARRLWVEEAAGITRYKNQKKVSLRKMEQAKDNLTRLEDILHEVETQMKRLQRQAKKAERHKELSAKARALDLNIVSHEYQRLRQEVEQVGREAQAIGAQLLLANQRVTGLETDQETMKVRLVSAEQEIRQAGERRMATQEAIVKAESEVSLLGREAENQRRMADRFQAERDALRQRLADLERQAAKARRISEQSSQSLEQSRAGLEEAERLVSSRRRELAGREDRLEQAKQKLSDHMFNQSRMKTRIGDLERGRAETMRRQEQLTGRQEQLEAELAEMGGQHAECARIVEELEEESRTYQSRAQGLKAQREQCRASVSQLNNAEREATRKLHAIKASLEGLSISLDSHEWAATGVRKVLEASAAGSLGFEVMGLAADHLEVSPGAESLVEAALGPDLQAIIVPHGQAAQSLAQWADEHKLGAVRVAALDSLAAQGQSQPENTGALAEMVRPAPGFEPLAALLAGAGSAQNLEAAWMAARAMAPGQSVVTPQGHRLDKPGALWAGRLSQKNPSQSVLARRNELAKRRDDLQAAEGELERKSAARQAAEQELGQMDAELSQAAGRRQEMAERLAQRRQELYRLSDSAKMKQRQLEGLEFDAGEIWNELDRLNRESEELQGRLEDSGPTGERLEQELEEVRAGMASGREELEQAQETESRARLALASLKSEAEHALAEAGRLDMEAKGAAKRADELDLEMEAASGQVEDLLERKAAEQDRLAGLYAQLDQQDQDHQKARDLLSQAQVKAVDLESALKQARAEQRDAEQEGNKLDLRKRELNIQVENICEQALERCRVDLTSDYRDHLPEGSFDPETARQQLVKLRQRLHNMGPVNMEAIAEHQALSERHEFLYTQREDLESSLEDLRAAIRKINKTSRDRFTSTLELVNSKLEEVFPVLFGGGRAQLSLDEGEGIDPLDAGLHLLVEPPGKKLRNIVALSGGEKAMSAAAVLFALFLIRPAPFCIMDEVDAPLDEANVGRFHDLLKNLAERSQLMLITHSRRTMEMMDTLYGVTMEEKGVSKLLSVDLKEGESLAA